jgi:hypothetical protein
MLLTLKLICLSYLIAAFITECKLVIRGAGCAMNMLET